MGSLGARCLPAAAEAACGEGAGWTRVCVQLQSARSATLCQGTWDDLSRGIAFWGCTHRKGANERPGRLRIDVVSRYRADPSPDEVRRSTKRNRVNKRRRRSVLVGRGHGGHGGHCAYRQRAHAPVVDSGAQEGSPGGLLTALEVRRRLQQAATHQVVARKTRSRHRLLRRKHHCREHATS